MELDKVCELFEEAANQSQIVTNNIVRYARSLHMRLPDLHPAARPPEAPEAGTCCDYEGHG